MAASFRAFARAQRTAEYFDYVLTRLTTVGALYLSAVCLLPEILISQYADPVLFGRDVAC